MAETGRGTKRARTEEEDSGGSSSEAGDNDVKLSSGLAAVLGKGTYVKESALTREAMLRYLKQKNDVTEVTLVKVSVQEMGGRTFQCRLEDKSTVGALKSAVADQEGFACWTQQLFRFGKGSGVAGASVAPLADAVLLNDEDQFALCVDGQDGGDWDASSPLLSEKMKQYDLSGEGNCRATKLYQERGQFNNCLMMSEVMESGKHRMSFEVAFDFDEEASCYGLVRDGAPWNEDPAAKTTTDGWFMGSDGSLYGNSKPDGIILEVGRMNEGDIVSLEADLDEGTLRFWVNGTPHGPGWSSGVKGKMRWAVSLGYKGNSAQIVPTPELEPWKEWDGKSEDDGDNA